jgi:hypothetical protein
MRNRWVQLITARATVEAPGKRQGVEHWRRFAPN